MFCTNCGTELPQGANFCYNCGEKQNVVVKATALPDIFEYSTLVDYQYDSVDMISHIDTSTSKKHYYLQIRQANKIGIASCDFSRVYLECKYDDIDIFSCREPFFRAKKDGQLMLFNQSQFIMGGYYDSIIIRNLNYPPRFFIYKQNGKYGIKFYPCFGGSDILYQPVYDEIKEKGCDTVFVRQNSKWGLINSYRSETPVIFDDIKFIPPKNNYGSDSLLLKYQGYDYVFPHVHVKNGDKTHCGYDLNVFGVFFLTYIINY